MLLAEIVIRYVVSAFMIVLFARILLSYFPLSPGGPMETVSRFAGAVTDPVLQPVRRLLPPVSLGPSGAGLDLSPLVVFAVCWVILFLV